MFYPLSDSETKHEEIKKESLNIKPDAETVIEPVTDQEENTEMVNFQIMLKTLFCSFLVYFSLSVSNHLEQSGEKV